MLSLFLLCCLIPPANDQPRVGAAAVAIPAEDGMVIGGGIHAGKATGQEGQLRAVAVVIERSGTKVALAACDVLMLTRDLLDPVADTVAKSCGIQPSHLLINATHTHHAPSTVTVHGYARDEVFCRRVQQALVQAIQQANDRLKHGPARLEFALGEESSVGQNSRLLLRDDTIFWIGPRDDAVRPTGPFDPQLPVLAFRDADRKLRALLFNHSTHTIGVRKSGRSPSFYGLAAQELEAELGGTVAFFEGASGSTHNLSVPCAEMIVRMKQSVQSALARAEPMALSRLDAQKWKFSYRVRRFDEAKEEAAVSAYCRKRTGGSAEPIIEVFRKQRQVLAPRQGEERATWLQVVRLGDIVFVGVPAEFFTVLGQEIKRRSPFRYTYVAELANDWIGYVPDRKAFELGGYQTWTGLHSLVEPGTGEAMVDDVVRVLRDMAR